MRISSATAHDALYLLAGEKAEVIVMFGVFVPDELIVDTELNSNDIRVWLMMAKLSRKYGHCFASAKYIGDRLNLSKATVFRNIKHLEECGYLERKSREGKTSVYWVKTPHSNSYFTNTRLTDDMGVVHW